MRRSAFVGDGFVGDGEEGLEVGCFGFLVDDGGLDVAETGHSGEWCLIRSR